CRRARVGEFVTQGRDGFRVDVGEHHRHPKRGRMASKARTDSRTGTRDDGHAAAKRVASGHANYELAAAEGLRYWTKGTESSASRMTFIDVNTRPSTPRRTPTSTTPLDTANGTALVTWLTNR